jgi:uncharacterized protein (DUF924 family)
MSSVIATPREVRSFWREAGPKRWYQVDPTFDDLIRSRFLATWEAAHAGAIAAWEDTAENALALVIVLDQFPRNMFRGQAQAFASDQQARVVAGRAIERHFDQAVASPGRNFFYLPFMHSEAPADQDRSVALVEAIGDADSLKHAEAHRDLIRRFGRFPFRNQALGRISTPEEAEYLAAGGYRT